MNPLTYGQSKCQTFQEFEKNGNSVQELDSLYPSGLNIDTNIAVFKNEEEKKFLKVWGVLFYDLDSFLFDNGFKWEKHTWYFHKVYFSKKGKIDHWLFNFRKGEVSNEKQEEFIKLVNDFKKHYRLGLKGDKDFAQCGSTTFYPK